MGTHVDDRAKGIYPEILSYNDEYYSVILNPSTKFSPDKLIWLTNKGERELDLSVRPHWKKIISEGFFDDKKFPWMIVNGNTDLLAEHRLSRDQLLELKDKHLAIFMFEPLFLRDKHGSYPQNRGAAACVFSVELDCVQKFLKNHHYAFKATVFTCDYAMGEYLHSSHRYLDLDIKTFDTFLINENFHYVRDIESFTPVREFKKHVICPNYRYQSARELMVAYIRGREAQGKSYLSYFHRPHRERLLIDVPFEIENCDEWDILAQGLESMKNEVPYVLDTSNSTAVDQDEHPIPDMKKGSNQRSEKGIRNLYRESFVALANETNFFSPCPEVSEKVMTPIGVGRPFIVAGAAHSLRHLREMGFKTFHDFWDESYDEEVDPYRRLQKIWKLLDWIYSREHSELLELDEKMRPVLAYNHHYLYHGFMKHESKRIEQLVETSRATCHDRKVPLWHKIKGFFR